MFIFIKNIESKSITKQNKIKQEKAKGFDKAILNKASIVNEIGCRNNYYGRPIWNIEETKENKLINNYVQSTAVDIALSYFSELCDKINLELCKPVYIIHDALILDVHNDYISDIMNILDTGYNCEKLGHFPVEIEKLSETF